MRHLRLRVFEGQRILRGFGVCVAVLGLALAARGQSPDQAEGYGACQVPSEVAPGDAGQSLTPTFISFEAPGAGNHNGQGTLPLALNSAGAITGNYFDSRSVSHGFLRAANGVITSFDARGAGTHTGQGTFARSINPAGVITGYYQDSSLVYHGFVRAANGVITSFDVSGAVNTEALGINSAGMIAGYYSDSFNSYHGFVRAANGVITSFDAPDALGFPNQGTFPYAINDPCGTITGFYFPTSLTGVHAFVRYPDHTFGIFPPINSALFAKTVAFSITSACPTSITGEQLDLSNVYHGFVRAPDGTIIDFDAPGAGTGANQGTQGASINSAGTVTGDYIDSVNAYHGFVRSVNGGTTITTFDAPGAGTGASQGTFPATINSSGVIAGYYLDSSNVYHGFVRK